MSSDAEIDIKTISLHSREYEMEIKLRNKILREPLGLKLNADDLKKDLTDIHLGAFANNVLIGCAVYKDSGPDSAQMRQVAVDVDCQGRGVGQRLVKAFEELAFNNNKNILHLNAREGALNFYLRMGYQVMGKPSTEVTIAHYQMVKNLKR